MQRIFIFAEQVRIIVAEGNKEIEVPEGARISSAAADLIKDHKLKIKATAPQSASAKEFSRSGDKSLTDPSTSSQDTPTGTEPQSAPLDSSSVSGADISEEELEALVNQVIERFKQIKGIAPALSEREQAKDAEPQPTPADDDDMIICRCEEITKGEIKAAIRNGMLTVNGVKRITRAGMGLCQGQTCQRLVIQIIAEELRQSAADIEPTTARGPVRPLRMAVFANS